MLEFTNDDNSLICESVTELMMRYIFMLEIMFMYVYTLFVVYIDVNSSGTNNYQLRCLIA